MYNLNNAPQVLLDKYYELDNIKGELPQAAIQDIISILQQNSGIGLINYKEDRFETKLLNGKVLPQVHIVMKSNMALLQQSFVYNDAQQEPQIRLDYSAPQVQDNIVYCSAAQQDDAILRKIQLGEGLDPLL